MEGEDVGLLEGEDDGSTKKVLGAGVVLGSGLGAGVTLRPFSQHSAVREQSSPYSKHASWSAPFEEDKNSGILSGSIKYC